MDDLYAIFSYLYTIFIFILKRTVDLLVSCLLVISLCCPWRSWFVCRAIIRTVRHHDKSYVHMCCLQFGIVIMDCVSFPFGFASLVVPTRSIPALYSFLNCICNGDESEDSYCNYDLRGLCFKQFGISFLDIFLIPMGLIATLAPWRFWYTLKRFKAHAEPCFGKFGDCEVYWNGEHRYTAFGGFIIVVIDAIALPLGFVSAFSIIRSYHFFKDFFDERVEWTGHNDNDFNFAYQFRLFCIRQFAELVLDTLFVPLVIVLLLSWRCVSGFHIVFSKSHLKKEHSEDRRVMIVLEFFELIKDLPFFIIFVFLLCTLWRAYSVVHLVLDNSKEKRIGIFILLRKFFSEIFFVLLFLVIPFMLYRLPLVILGVISSMSSLKKDQQQVQVVGLNIRFDEHSRCLSFHFNGDKNYAISQISGVKLAIGADDFFWMDLENEIGGVSTIVARGMLPFALKDNVHMKYSDITSSQQQIGSDISIPTFSTKKTITDYIRSLGDDRFCVQLQCDSGVLFSIVLCCADVLFSLNTGDNLSFRQSIDSSELVSFQKDVSFNESFANAVSKQFTQLVLDVFYLFCFCLLVIFPWRLFAVLLLLFEDTKFWHIRIHHKMVSLVDITTTLRKDFLDIYHVLGGVTLKSNQFDVSFCELQDSCLNGQLRGTYLKRYDELSKKFTVSVNSLISEPSIAPTLALFYQAESDIVFFHTLLFRCSASWRKKEIDRSNYLFLISKVSRELERVEQDFDRYHNQLLETQKLLSQSFSCFSFGFLNIFKRGVDQTRAIVKSMVFAGIFDLFTLVGMLLIFSSLYRLVPFIKQLKRARTWEFKRFVVVDTLHEIILDIFFLFQVVFISITLYYIIDFWLSILWKSDETPSIYNMRKTANDYSLLIINNFSSFFRLFSVWETYRFCIAIIVFAIFTPAQCLSNIFRPIIFNDLHRHIISTLMYFTLMIVPIVFILENSADSSSTTSIVIASILLIVFLISIFSLVSIPNFVDIPAPSSMVFFNWCNILALFQIGLDTIQLSSFPISFFNQSTSYVETDLSDAILDKLNVFFSYFLFIDPLRAGDPYIISFWFFVSISILWILLIGAPVVIEGLMKWGTVSDKHVWRQAVFHLSNTFFISIVVNLLKPLQCAGDGLLVGYPTLNCWHDTDHVNMAAVAMPLLIFYMTTASSFSDQQTKLPESLDIKYSPSYDGLLNITKIFIAAAFAIFYNFPIFVLWLSLCVNVFLFAWTALFFKIFKKPCCCISWVTVLRCASFFCGIWSSLLSLIARSSTFDRFGLVLIIGLFLIVFVSLVISVFFIIYERRQRVSDFNALTDVRQWLTQIISAASNQKILKQEFVDQLKFFNDDVSEATSVSTLARLLENIEASIFFSGLSQHFLNNRYEWIQSIRLSSSLTITTLRGSAESLFNAIQDAHICDPISPEQMMHLDETFEILCPPFNFNISEIIYNQPKCISALVHSRVYLN